MAEAKGKQTKFDLVIGAVDKLTGPFKRMNDAVTKKTENIRKLQESCKNLSAESGIGKLRAKFTGLGQNISGALGATKSFASSIAGLVGKFSLLFGAAGGGMFGLIHSTAAAGDAAAKAAARAGVGVKTWQEYSYAAGLCDVSNEELQKSFGRLTELSLKAAKGGKEQAKMWKEAGINIRTSNKEVKNSDMLMRELADKVKKLTDAGKKSEALDLSKRILGEEGAKLMPMLAAGADGINDLRKEAHKLGVVLSGEDAAASEEFNDSVSRMQAGLKGFGFTIGREVMPFATDLVKTITDWIAANRELVQTKVKEWVARFKAYLPELKKNIGLLIDKVGEFANKLSGLVDGIGGWGNAFKIIGAIMAGSVLSSLVGVAKGFVTLGAAIMTTPVGWVLGAAAAIGAAVYLIYDNWDSIGTYFSEKLAPVKDIFNNTWNGISSFFSGKIKAISTAFDTSWTHGVLKILSEFSPLGFMVDGMNAVVKYFTGIDLAPAGNAVVNSIAGGINAGWTRLTKMFKDKIDQLTGLLPDWLKGQLGIGGSPSSGAASPVGAPISLGDPVGAAQMMQSSHETKTTHIEKNQLEITVKTQDGATATATGKTSKDVSVSTSGAYIGQGMGSY